MTDQPQILTLTDRRFFREQSGSRRIALGYRPGILNAPPQMSAAMFFGWIPDLVYWKRSPRSSAG